MKAFPQFGKTVRCSGCGEIVERSDRCANCGVRLKKPWAFVTRMGIFCGLIILAVVISRAVNRREPGTVHVADIKPYMNFKRVRIEGVLLEPARELKSGSVFHLVHDGTGQLAVFVPAVSVDMPLPGGARVEAEGNLRVGAGNRISLQATTIRMTGQTESAGSESRISRITPDREGETMLVNGVVSSVWKPRPDSKAPYRIVLEDPTGRIDVIHWLENPPEVEEGEPLEVTGIVQIYNGRLELKVIREEWIQCPGTAEVPPEEIQIGDIHALMEGRVVIAEGVLGEPRSIPGGVIYPMSDDTGTIQLLFWDSRVSGEERDAVDEGRRLRVEAPVVLYKGTLELVPRDVGGFRVLD
ncbi:hypothetical protein [Pontiella agarivorans]|uniref:OB domain-containing protein n=1 Tax=Pontiella agarivorans TaxID=3038953 RepID=A0ABU5MZY0_9BACT|nr:hypothetical protein [Pontiella agarivorans]MDZ8119729.1 hypothetical protein [Pontiella agarivorans]